MVILTSARDPFWTGMLALAVGGAFPNPKYKNKKPNETVSGEVLDQQER
jgi:hypothetical protein